MYVEVFSGTGLEAAWIADRYEKKGIDARIKRDGIRYNGSEPIYLVLVRREELANLRAPIPV